MPSEKILAEKQQYVKELAEKFKKASAGVLVDYKGITVAQDTKLRAGLRAAGVDYSVKKNTLIRLAVREAGLEKLEEVLTGSTAIALSDDDLVAPAKLLAKFAETNDKFKIKAGFVEGNAIDAAQVKALASLPAKEVLIAQVLGGLNAPITGFANVLNGNIRGLVVALNAIAEKKSA